jgi:hypothetical protein
MKHQVHTCPSPSDECFFPCTNISLLVIGFANLQGRDARSLARNARRFRTAIVNHKMIHNHLDSSIKGGLDPEQCIFGPVDFPDSNPRPCIVPRLTTPEALHSFAQRRWVLYSSFKFWSSTTLIFKGQTKEDGRLFMLRRVTVIRRWSKH